MPLLPGASVKTKYDFTRCRFEWKRQFQVASTANILEEGSVLVRKADPVTGEEVVDLGYAGALAAGDAFCGIALISRITADTFTIVERVTIPSVAGVVTVQLGHANLVGSKLLTPTLSSEAYATDVAGVITFVQQDAAPAATGQFNVNPASGVASFWGTTDGGTVVDMTYRWNLTAIERDALLRQSHVNRGAEDQFGLMTVGFGNCWIYTTMYDAEYTYSVGDPIYMADNGLFTSDDDGGASVAVARCISVPSVGDPYLGVEYISPA